MKHPHIPNGCDQQGRRESAHEVDPEMQAVLGIMTSPFAVIAVVAALLLLVPPIIEIIQDITK